MASSSIQGFTEQDMKETLVDILDRDFTVTIGEEEYDLIPRAEDDGLVIELVDPEGGAVRAVYRLRGPRLA